MVVEVLSVISSGCDTEYAATSVLPAPVEELDGREDVSNEVFKRTRMASDAFEP